MSRGARCALLAGTTLALLPQMGMAADPAARAGTDGTMVLAQAGPPATDPQGRPLPKGVQPKGAQPKGQPAAGQGAQTPPGQPKQTQQRLPGPPPGQPAQVGQPPQGKALPKQVQQPPQQQPAQQQPLQQQQLGQPPQGKRLPKQQQPAQQQPLQQQTPPQQLGQPPQGKGLPKQTQQPAQQQPLQQPLQRPAQQQPLQQQTPQQLGQPPQGKGLPKQLQQPAQQLPAQQLPQTQPGIQQGVLPGGQQGSPQLGRAPFAGNVDQLRSQRHERREAGGAVVIEEPGRRFIVRENGRAFIRSDETERFRRWGGEPRFERRGAEQFAYISRPGGYQIITVTDPNGRLLRRMRRGPDGREVILIDNHHHHHQHGGGPGAVAVGVGVGLAAGVILGLAAPAITIPRERYIVDTSIAPAPLLYETLQAPPLVAIERPYSIDEIRHNVALRDRMRRVDIDSITFDSGSWEVAPGQQAQLAVVADAVRRVIAQHPEEIFMIEGHTDAVGADVDNLSLSDRRAESVAVILTDAYQIPPENLVTQGYGEQHLKVPVDGPIRENRRVTVRRITPLLNGGVASR